MASLIEMDQVGKAVPWKSLCQIEYDINILSTRGCKNSLIDFSWIPFVVVRRHVVLGVVTGLGVKNHAAG